MAADNNSWTGSRSYCLKYSIRFEWASTDNVCLPPLGGFVFNLRKNLLREAIAGKYGKKSMSLIGHKLGIICRPEPQDVDMSLKVMIKNPHNPGVWTGVIDKTGKADIEFRNYCPLQNGQTIDFELLITSEFSKIDKVETMMHPAAYDFRIVLKRGNQGPAVTIPTSKSLLISRSEVFERMLASDLREAQTNQLELDLPRASVEEMVNFINTDFSKFENLALHGENDQEEAKLVDEAMDTAQLADCYQIIKLKQICSRFLQSRVSIANAPDFLDLSNKYSMFDLRDRVLRHLNANSRAAASNKEITNVILKDPKLSNQIVKALIGVYPELE